MVTDFTYYLQGTCKDVGIFPYVAPFAGILSASVTTTSIVTSRSPASVTSISLRTADSQATSLTSTPTPKTNVGAIAGGVISGVFSLLGLVAIVLFCLRRRRQGATGQEHNVTVDPNEKYVVSAAEGARLDASAVSGEDGINIRTMSYTGQGLPLGVHTPAELPGTEVNTHELSNVRNPRYEM